MLYMNIRVFTQEAELHKDQWVSHGLLSGLIPLPAPEKTHYFDANYLFFFFCFSL